METGITMSSENSKQDENVSLLEAASWTESVILPDDLTLKVNWDLSTVLI